jgi:uncharacterized membrane protein YoaK (UPF0700 family)
MRKKISLLGLILGFIAGALVAMLSGSWIFWLAVGMAIGVLLGAAGARHRNAGEMRHGANF